MDDPLKKPTVDKYTLDPYSARVLILQLEQQYDITIRVYDKPSYCMICIDKEDKKQDD